MTTCLKDSKSHASTNLAKALMCATVLVVGLGGCKHDGDGAQVAGWTLVDPSERHPILVSQQPQTMHVSVARGSGGLSPQQRGELMAFANRSSASDSGNSRIIVAVPSGSANEVAAMRAAHEVRELLMANGVAETAIAVEVYSGDRGGQPPIRVSYMRYVAEGPQCAQWTSNLAWSPQNLPHPNLGCTTQKNLAAMVANPADLLGPRTETPRPGERRDATWEKYLQGESSGAKKSQDEQIKTDGG